ncbi:MAG: M20 family metallopeptidase, partial [Planctomycetota bacterium]|nr:M20 family metallopeptidase [Planctomycetota bacterium]
GGVRVQKVEAGAGKWNVLAVKGPDGAEGGVALSGHMDVVPAEADGGTSEPFVLTDRGDRWVARGSADMKGVLALAVNLCRGVDGGRLKAPLGLLLTCDEELGSLGAQALARDAGALEGMPRRVVVGEPTSMRVVRMHKGHLKMRLVVEGVSAHSGYPQLGVNAIEPAGRAIVALEKLRKELEGERVETAKYFEQTPFATVNVARVVGGGAINVVPNRCEVEFGLRLLPGMDSEGMVERVRGVIEGAMEGAGHAVEVINDSPPMLLDEGASLSRILCEAVGQRGTATLSLASDAGTLQRLGFECALFGPGSIEVAHKADEWLPKEEFARARGVLERVVERMCVDGE